MSESGFGTKTVWIHVFLDGTLLCVSKCRVFDPEDGGTAILGDVANPSLNDTRCDLDLQQQGRKNLKCHKSG